MTPPLPAPVRRYLDDLIAIEAGAPGRLVALVLFGSAATGGYAATVSDVDLLVVLADDADPATRARVRDAVAAAEARHGLAKEHPASRLAAALDRLTANVRAFFVCTRADLLSGEPARILGIPRAQARFVDRAAIPSIVGSGATVWGEELLPAVPLPPLRRVDVAKAFQSAWGAVVLGALAYPFLPGATRYAMDALKRAVHNCHFVHHARPAALADEVAFFQRRYRPLPVLDRLLALRRAYRPSLGFVLACLPALVRLHWWTARANRFPRPARPAAWVTGPRRPRGAA